MVYTKLSTLEPCIHKQKFHILIFDKLKRQLQTLDENNYYRGIIKEIKVTKSANTDKLKKMFSWVGLQRNSPLIIQMTFN